jgi:hypothetical protein
MDRDLITELKLILDFDTQCITWDNIDQPMKQGEELAKETYPLRRPYNLPYGT